MWGDSSFMGSDITTDYLVSTPSTAVGAGSLFNLAGGYYVYNTSSSSEQADFDAIRRDWQVTSQDFREAVNVSIVEASRE